MPEFESETIVNTTYALGCSKEMAVDILREIDRQKKIAIGNFVHKIKEDIKKWSSNKVINAEAPEESKKAFIEGEDTGREFMRKLALDLIDRANDPEVLLDEGGKDGD